MRIEIEGEPTISQPAPTLEEIRFQGSANLEQAKTKLWDKISKTETVAKPIEEEDIAEEPEEDAPVALPDRTLVAKNMAEFLRAKREAPNPLAEQAERIEAAINKLQKPKENLSFEQLVAHKLETIEKRMERRELEEAQRREQETYEKQMTDYSKQVSDYLTSKKEDYPGIVALGRTDAVFNQLYSFIEAGQDVSEADVARAMEDQLRVDFNKLKSVYDAPSKAAPQGSKQKPTNNKTPLRDDEIRLERFSSVKDAQAALWNKVAVRGNRG
jgi:hypothetical protein